MFQYFHNYLHPLFTIVERKRYMNDQHDAHVFVVVPSSIFLYVISSFFVRIFTMGSNISLSMRTKKKSSAAMPSKIEDNFREFPEAAMAFFVHSFFLPSGIFFPSETQLRAERGSNGFLLAWCERMEPLCLVQGVNTIW